MCEELHSSLEFLDYFGKDNNDEADDGALIWIHEGVWEYMGGRGYVGIRADECGRPASNIKWLMSPPF